MLPADQWVLQIFGGNLASAGLERAVGEGAVGEVLERGLRRGWGNTAAAIIGAIDMLISSSNMVGGPWRNIRTILARP